MTLDEQIVFLESQVSELKKSLVEKDKEEFLGLRRQLGDAILITEDLDGDYQRLLNALSWSQFYSEIAAANLPTSDAYGFNFIEIIEKEARNSLMAALPAGDEARNRLMNIIAKIVNNPVAEVLLRSSPFGAIVSNVISAASNFIDTTTSGNVIKGYTSVTKDVIAKERIDLFRGALQKYVHFYDNLQVVTNRLLGRFDYLEAKCGALKSELNGYYIKYLEALGIDDKKGGVIDQFYEVMKVPENASGDLDYARVLSKEGVRKAKRIAARAPEFRAQVDMFFSEFAEALDEFIGDYIGILQKSLDWAENEIDKNKISQRIQQLEAFRKEHIVHSAKSHKLEIAYEIRNINLIVATRELEEGYA